MSAKLLMTMIFLFCHPGILENENIKFDFIINTRSFMEMNKKIIKEYFNFIQKKLIRMDIF